jgi:hypothetical protein
LLVLFKSFVLPSLVQHYQVPRIVGSKPGTPHSKEAHRRSFRISKLNRNYTLLLPPTTPHSSAFLKASPNQTASRHLVLQPKLHSTLLLHLDRAAASFFTDYRNDCLRGFTVSSLLRLILSSIAPALSIPKLHHCGSAQTQHQLDVSQQLSYRTWSLGG